MLLWFKKLPFLCLALAVQSFRFTADRNISQFQCLQNAHVKVQVHQTVATESSVV